MDNAPLAYVWPDGDFIFHEDLEGMEPEVAKHKSDDYKIVYEDTNLNELRVQFNSDEEFTDFVREIYGFIKWY